MTVLSLFHLFLMLSMRNGQHFSFPLLIIVIINNGKIITQRLSKWGTSTPRGTWMGLGQGTPTFLNLRATSWLLHHTKGT